MKKRSLRERKEAFKEAYRNELTKQGIIDAPKEKEPKKVLENIIEEHNEQVKKAIKITKKVGEENGK